MIVVFLLALYLNQLDNNEINQNANIEELGLSDLDSALDIESDSTGKIGSDLEDSIIESDIDYKTLIDSEALESSHFEETDTISDDSETQNKDTETISESSEISSPDVVLSSESDYSISLSSDKSSEDTHSKEEPDMTSNSDYSSSSRGDRSSEDSEDKDLSDEQVAGIVASSILGVGGLAAIIYGILVLCGVITCCSCCSCCSCRLCGNKGPNPNSSTSQDFIFEADQAGSYGRMEDI